MSEWWTYGPSDFLMFSPRTYWRLVESYNRAAWPAPLVAWAAGMLALWLAARGNRPRTLAPLLAAAWLWVAWAFYWQRLAPIYLAAPWLAGAFAIQASMLLLAGLSPAADRHRLPTGNTRFIGAALAGAGILLYPLLPLLLHRPLAQAEVFGWMPEPTALATLGILLMGGLPLSRKGRWLLAVLPVLSLAAGWALQWILRSH